MSEPLTPTSSQQVELAQVLKDTTSTSECVQQLQNGDLLEFETSSLDSSEYSEKARSLSVSLSPSSLPTKQRQASPDTVIMTPNTRDSSPELEIVDVRKIKRPAPTSAPRAPKTPVKSHPHVQTGLATPFTPSMVQKRESFDMSVIDPVLRDASTAVSTTSEASTGMKRPLEILEGEASSSKKRKEDAASTKHDPLAVAVVRSVESDTADHSNPRLPSPSNALSQLSMVPWSPNTWTKQDYLHLVAAVDRTFNYRAYAHHHKRHAREVVDVFRGLVMDPLLEAVQKNMPTNPGEALMKEYSRNETTMQALLADDEVAKLKALKARALVEVGAELRVTIEDEIKTQLKNEGWVQLNKAKDLIAGYEREINEVKPEESDSSGGKGKAKIKPLQEAQKDLLAASIAFEKARKAEERKSKQAEREAKGDGNCKKLGRPKKDKDGKGKGAEFC